MNSIVGFFVLLGTAARVENVVTDHDRPNRGGELSNGRSAFVSVPRERIAPCTRWTLCRSIDGCPENDARQLLGAWLTKRDLLIFLIYLYGAEDGGPERTARNSTKPSRRR